MRATLEGIGENTVTFRQPFIIITFAESKLISIIKRHYYALHNYCTTDVNSESGEQLLIIICVTVITAILGILLLAVVILLVS